MIKYVLFYNFIIYETCENNRAYSPKDYPFCKMATSINSSGTISYYSCYYYVLFALPISFSYLKLVEEVSV